MDLVLKKNSMTCFRYIQAVAALSFLLMFATAVTPVQVCYGCLQADAVNDDNSAKINALIRDLRAPKFAVREAATQRLIEIGSPAVAALRTASESDSLEVRVRAQTVLASILKDQDSSFGSSEQATIKQFQDAEATGRFAILKAQADAKNLPLFLHLLDVVVAEEANTNGDDQKESSIELLVTDETSSPLTQLISLSLISKNWSAVEKVLTHPGILKYSPMLRVNEAQKAGKLDAYVEDRLNSSRKHIQNSK